MYKPGMVVIAIIPASMVKEVVSEFKSIREACVLLCFTVKNILDRRQESRLRPQPFQENQNWNYSDKDSSDAFCSKMVE